MHLSAMNFQKLLGFLLLRLLPLLIFAATDIWYTDPHVDLLGFCMNMKTFAGIKENSSSDNGRTLWKFICSPLFLLCHPQGLG